MFSATFVLNAGFEVGERKKSEIVLPPPKESNKPTKNLCLYFKFLLKLFSASV